ncbi:response regulator transcription factor [Roseateles depolymerans]|uniref:LuxR family transcriptional regulator n=1 Tax=Roseateles depolymerans TaxID=76731 RepID=A0A0U3LP73_9BURK|nr:response regulator [Roseateles depolymerans]ALV08226.1 LuxR family transcriptional regulator [Roseateles depolymerans]REG21549.1 LuxR family two component transcriptional regulator [Roseateles depolymerans]
MNTPLPTSVAALLEQQEGDRVLLVDDVPDNLSLLHDALDEHGYTVLAATSGEAALTRALQGRPDIVLLDAMMPGMDGFEVARRLKADPATAHIPIIFMTGLTETEHLVAALQAGGVDYVTKPLDPRAVLARMQVHLQGARQARQTRQALDAFGYASIAVRASSGRLLWQTPLARELLQLYFGTMAPTTPPLVLQWLRRCLEGMGSVGGANGASGAVGMGLQDSVSMPPAEPPRLTAELGARRLSFRLHHCIGGEDGPGPGGDWLIVMREVSDAAVIRSLGLSFNLTAREAEVLYWVVKGKINRDIGDILGASPATVKKHLERIHAKLGVETRTAAASMALTRAREIHPQWEL